MPVPNTFGTATSAIPLSQLDANFATPITIGNTAVQLGNTVTTLNNMTLANVTISSGTITITNVAVTTANVSGTANISTLVVVGNATVGGNTSVTGTLSATGIITGNNSIKSTTASAGQPEFVLTQTSVASWSIYNPPSSTDLRFYNGADRLVLSATGLAVTGTLSATGAIQTGSGNSTAAGLIAGYFGASGYGAIWSTGVTPSTSNFSFLTNATSTVLNGTTGDAFQVGNVDKMSLGASLLTVTPGATIQGLTVGLGAGAVATNTAVGKNALAGNVGGLEQVAVGQDALFTNQSGSYNTAVGLGALKLNLSGSNNTALGYLALLQSTASDNTAVGYQAGYTNINGNGNVFVGYQAGFLSNYPTNGAIQNCFVGYSAGSAITTGYKNTIIGTFPGNLSSLDIRTKNNNIVMSDGDGYPLFGRLYGQWTQSVSTAFVAFTPVSGVGMFVFINGYNASTGAQGNWIISANGTSGVTVVNANNSTGLTVSFDYAGSQLRMLTASGQLGIAVFYTL